MKQPVLSLKNTGIHYDSRLSLQINISVALCNFCRLLNNGALPVGERSHTWEQGVLYAEHGRPAAGVHGLHQLLLGHVGSAVLDADARLQVVEVASVELEELNEQHAQVLTGVAGVDAWVELQGSGHRGLLQWPECISLSSCVEPVLRIDLT